MSFVTPTLSAAVALNDTTVLLSALTSIVAGGLIRIDNEYMRVLSVPAAATTPVPVLRGQEGSAQVAHPISAQATFGLTPSNLGTDWTQPAAGQGVLGSGAPAVVYQSYSASGAITLPGPNQIMIAELNGTGALAMTVAAPTAAIRGSKLTIVGNGKAAHTVTFTTGLGAVGATADVATFKADQQQALEVIAAGVAWQPSANVAGAATIAGVGLA